MIKQAPSFGRILAMVVFAMSCFGILMFLWLAFGGPVPLKPEGYRFSASFPEAATLAQESDVRMAGVNIGKVKTKELEKGAARTRVEMEIKPEFAPIPADTRAILRQKTLLGETYVELSPGTRAKPNTGSAGSGAAVGTNVAAQDPVKKLDDGGSLPSGQVEPTVELDEIFSSFDRPTREAAQQWLGELRKVAAKGGSKDLNDVFGNLSGFAVDGATLLQVLDQQRGHVGRLVKNTGEVFGAINEREGALRELITGSNEVFSATAARDEALAETFRTFPTFLRESRSTLAELEDFSNNARPVVRDLQKPADDLGPTIRDLGELAPDLQGLFRDLPPLIRTSRQGLPDLQRTLRGARPVVGGLNSFLDELNPILSTFNFYQARIAGFITNAAADLSGDAGGERYQTNIAIIEPRSLEYFTERPDFDRGTAYLQPNSLARTLALGTYETLKCIGGEKPNPVDATGLPPLLKNEFKRAPCFELPPSLYDGRIFNYPRKGEAPNRRAPQGTESTRPIPPNLGG